MEPPKTYLNQQRDGLFYWFFKKKFFFSFNRKFIINIGKIYLAQKKSEGKSDLGDCTGLK